MKTSFTTICSREKLSEIRAFLYSILKGLNITERMKNELVLAVDEACANAMIHGNECDHSRTLQLDLEITDEEFVVEISDVGSHDIPDQKYHERTLEEIIRER